LADRRSLLILSVLVLISVALVASIVLLSTQAPSATPNPSETPSASHPVFATLPPNDQPAVTLRDFVFKTQTVTSVTASPAQSKLWFAEGSWWAGLYSPDPNEIHIFRLDWTTQTWIDTGTVVDERSDVDSDYLWTGEYLYVASASKGIAPSHRARIQRFHFDPKAQRFVGDADFPVAINDTGASGIVIDRDTRGGLWVTYVSGGALWVAHTLSSDAHWAAPYAVPVSGPLVDDDISSLIPFGPGRIGVMWTDQTTERVLFTTHTDGEADDAWTPVEVVATGVGTNDDQLNLKTFELGGSRVVATTIRTTVDSDADQNPLDPQVLVLVRDGEAHWTASEASRVENKHNRAILLIDEQRRFMYVAAQTPTSGGIVTIKRAALDKPIFPTGDGDPLIKSSDDPAVASATSSKQNLSAAAGLVVLASDDTTGRYLHAAMDLGSTPIAPDVAGRPVGPDRPAPPKDPVARPLVNDEFASWPNGEPVTGWTVDASNGTAVAGGKGDLRYLALKSTKAAGFVQACKELPQVGATRLIVDVRFRPSVGGSGEIRPLGVSGAGGEVAGLRIADDGEFSYFDGAVRQRPGTHLADGRWYRARLDIDVNGKSADLLLANAAGKTIIKKTGLDWRTNEPGQPRKVCFQVSGTPATLDVDRVTVSR
jgi:hypothetical protein